MKELIVEASWKDWTFYSSPGCYPYLHKYCNDNSIDLFNDCSDEKYCETLIKSRIQFIIDNKSIPPEARDAILQDFENKILKYITKINQSS